MFRPESGRLAMSDLAIPHHRGAGINKFISRSRDIKDLEWAFSRCKPLSSRHIQGGSREDAWCGLTPLGSTHWIAARLATVSSPSVNMGAGILEWMPSSSPGLFKVKCECKTRLLGLSHTEHCAVANNDPHPMTAGFRVVRNSKNP
jgi:hypothetical protein